MSHHGGCVWGCKLLRLGSVRRCVVVFQEVGCDGATRTRAEGDKIGWVGCARVTGGSVEKLATKTGVERLVTLTGCVSNSVSSSVGAAVAAAVISVLLWGVLAIVIGGTYPELGFGCGTVRGKVRGECRLPGIMLTLETVDLVVRPLGPTLT